MLHFRPMIHQLATEKQNIAFIYIVWISIFDIVCLHIISKKLFDPSQVMISMQKKNRYIFVTKISLSRHYLFDFINKI